MARDDPPAEPKKLGAYLFCSPATIRGALQRQGLSLANPRPDKQLGEILVESGAITVEELDAAVRAQRIARLRACPLFSALSKMELAALGSHFDEVSVAAGEQFITEGSEDRTLYVVATGEVEVFRTDEDGHEVVLATVASGEPIGEMGYFAGGVRTASVRALQATELLRASYDDLTEYFENVPRVAHAFIDVVEQRRADTTRRMKAHTHDRKHVHQQLPQLAGLVDLAQPHHGVEHMRRSIERLLARAGRELDAERLCLFVPDPQTGELRPLVAEGVNTRKLRLRAGRGVAGWVADNRELANIFDAYEDERFAADLDELTGVHTHTVLAAPVIGAEDTLLGVVEALNKQLGAFTEDDESLLKGWCEELADALENHRNYETTLTQTRRLACALEVATRLAAGLPVPLLMRAIEDSAARQLDCDACQLMLVDPATNSLRSVARAAGSLDMVQQALESAPAGRVAIEGGVLAIDAEGRDRDLLRRVGNQLGIETPAVTVAVPVRDPGRRIVAILQVARLEARRLDEEAIAWLETIAAQIGTAAVFQAEAAAPASA